MRFFQVPLHLVEFFTQFSQFISPKYRNLPLHIAFPDLLHPLPDLRHRRQDQAGDPPGATGVDQQNRQDQADAEDPEIWDHVPLKVTPACRNKPQIPKRKEDYDRHEDHEKV